MIFSVLLSAIQNINMSGTVEWLFSASL